MSVLLSCIGVIVGCIAVVSASNVYCVKPSNSVVSCSSKEHECKDLSYYVSNKGQYFTNDTTFEFLSGKHILRHANVSIKGVRNLKFTGERNACISTVLLQQEQKPQISCEGEAGLLFQEAWNLTLSSISFSLCGHSVPSAFYNNGFGEAKATLAFKDIWNLILSDLDVYNSSGYGFLMHNMRGHSTIDNCELLYNRGAEKYRGGNVHINYTDCFKHSAYAWVGAEIKIYNSVFSYGENNFNDPFNTGTFATGITIILSCTNVNIIMHNVTAEGNKNNNDLGYGGNAFVHFFSERTPISNQVIITNSRFLNGSAWLGGGVGITLYIGASNHTNKCMNIVSIRNSVFNGNKASSGSGLYMDSVQNLRKNRCSITININNCQLNENDLYVRKNQKNLANVGIVTILAEKLSGVTVTNPNTYNVSFDNVTVERSTLSTPDYQRVIWGSAAIYAKDFLDNLVISNCDFQHNNMTAISAFHSHVTFTGNINIENNTGVNGGGIILCESSKIILTPNTNITVAGNHALGSGGGIYVDDSCSGSTPLCFYQIENIQDCGDYNNISHLVDNCSIQVYMINNTSGYAGSQIFGGSVGYCYMHTVYFVLVAPIFNKIFHEEGPSTDLSKISSTPKMICFCANSSTIVCDKEVMQHTQQVYPGESVTLYVVTVGQENGTVPGIIRINTSANHYETYSTKITCTEISFTASSTDLSLNATYEFVMVTQVNDNTSYVTSQSKYLNVEFKECPQGYMLNSGKGICDCHTEWKNIKCNFSSLLLIRSPPAWIGYLRGHVVYQTQCPFDYCKDVSVNLAIDEHSSFNPNRQCFPNRHGILCGACKEGFSLSASSSDCIDCSKHPTWYLVGYILGQLFSGVALIMLLTVANWTITDGTLSGLLFYANIFRLNMFLFFPHRFNAITVIISIMNLEFHFSKCAYHGLDAYTKAWLAFVFPVYVWALIAIIIYLSKRFNCIAKLFGGNGVKILATLIELSYAGLTQAVITAISPISIIVQTPNETTSLRWVYDPNIQYMETKHFLLFTTGIVFGFLILIHTLILLFVQPLQAYSHLRCFSWVAKFKPLIDAYTSPHIIKQKCRFWPGLLLLVRLSLIIRFAVNVKISNQITTNAIVSGCLFIAMVAWSCGGVYKKGYLNLLNTLFISNLAVLALLTKSHKENPTLVAYISVSVAIFTACVILLSHLAMRLRKGLNLKCRSRRVRFFRNPLVTARNYAGDYSEDSALLPPFRD